MTGPYTEMETRPRHQSQRVKEVAATLVTHSMQVSRQLGSLRDSITDLSQKIANADTRLTGFETEMEDHVVRLSAQIADFGGVANPPILGQDAKSQFRVVTDFLVPGVTQLLDDVVRCQDEAAESAHTRRSRTQVVERMQDKLQKGVPPPGAFPRRSIEGLWTYMESVREYLVYRTRRVEEMARGESRRVESVEKSANREMCDTVDQVSNRIWVNGALVLSTLQTQGLIQSRIEEVMLRTNHTPPRVVLNTVNKVLQQGTPEQPIEKTESQPEVMDTVPHH